MLHLIIIKQFPKKATSTKIPSVQLDMDAEIEYFYFLTLVQVIKLIRQLNLI